MAQLMPLPLTVSSFSKIQIGFTFLVPADPGSPGKRAVKRVCVLCKAVFTCILREFYAGFVSTADHKSDDETEKFIPLSAASGRKRNPYWYGYRIAKFGQAGKVGKVCLVMFSCLFSALGM